MGHLRFRSIFAVLILCLPASAVLADATILTDSSFGSTAAVAKIDVVESGNDLNFTVTMVGIQGDLRGFFFNVVNPNLLSDLAISGPHVTSTQLSLNGVSNLGNGANINPAGPFDVGIEFGTPGIGTDDLNSVTFTLHSTGLFSGITNLDLEDLLAISPNPDHPLTFGVRATSVGANRDGSSKFGALSPVPEPASVLTWFALSSVAALVRLRRSKSDGPEIASGNVAC